MVRSNLRIWKRVMNMKMVRKRLVGFPKTLKKIIRDKEGRWIRGIRGYHYYAVSEGGRRKLNRLPLNLKRHLCLPLPEHQANDDHCLHHALINSLESRIRIARWKMDPRYDTPRLSIQHAIDITAPMDDPDAVYNFLGIRDYIHPDLAPLGDDEVGVTTAENWPYRGPIDTNPRVLPLPRQVPEWERFRLDRVENCDKIYSHLRPDFEDVINFLISNMKLYGPIIAWFPVRTTHKDAKNIYTREGEPTGFTHTVVVTGWKKWRINGKLAGYWEYLDSYGLGEGRNGFGRITFDAVESVEIPVTF